MNKYKFPSSGDLTDFECPKCDNKLVYWDFGSGEDTELGMGCENCDDYEVQPDEMADWFYNPDELADEMAFERANNDKKG